jgi:hypothetical protein
MRRNAVMQLVNLGKKPKQGAIPSFKGKMATVALVAMALYRSPALSSATRGIPR